MVHSENLKSKETHKINNHLSGIQDDISSNSSLLSLPYSLLTKSSLNPNKSTTSLSSSMISPLNIPLANTLLNTPKETPMSANSYQSSGAPISALPSALQARYASTNLSVTNLVSNSNYNNQVQKSLSSLDVRSMTRDIALNQEILSLDEPWPALVIRVLPLFNGERLSGRIEELNDAVRTCLRTTDLHTLSNDIYHDLLAAGMFTLSAKLTGVHEDKLTNRLVELWTFFLGTVLPYLEGVFLPHQIELNAIKRVHQLSNVRTMALDSFKFHVIAPVINKLEVSLIQLSEGELGHLNLDIVARLIQMLSILNMGKPLEDQDQQKQFLIVLDLLKHCWMAKTQKK